MVHQRGNQRDGSPHYVFLYSDDENSGDEENIPLQSRTPSSSAPRKIEVINIQLKPEDTLQALALRYRCTISELKRINKIHKENEIFALRFIKVPIQPFSVLTETLAHTQISDGSGEPVQNGESSGIEREHSVSLTSLNTNPVTNNLQTEINTIILNSVCEPLSSYNSGNSFDINHAESDQLLNSTENNILESHVTDTFKCSGDDCGLSWAHLVGFSLMLGLACPIIYILYIAEFSSKTHSNH